MRIEIGTWRFLNWMEWELQDLPGIAIVAITNVEEC